MTAIFKKPVFLIAVCTVTLISALVYGYGYLDDRRAQASDALVESESCEQLAHDIETLRGSNHAATRPLEETALIRRISQAAAAAGVPDRNLDAIHTDPVRRAAAGPAMEKPTRLIVRNATLRQVITLLLTLDQPSQGVRLDKLRLAAEQSGPNSGSLWTAEATLVYTFAQTGNSAVTTRDPQ